MYKFCSSRQVSSLLNLISYYSGQHYCCGRSRFRSLAMQQHNTTRWHISSGRITLPSNMKPTSLLDMFNRPYVPFNFTQIYGSVAVVIGEVGEFIMC